MATPVQVQTASIGFAIPELGKTALCMLAILVVVAVSFRPGGLLVDDEQYLFLVKGFFTGRPFENLALGDGSLFLLRPLGYPVLLSIFHPLFGQQWELYPWTTALFGYGFAVLTWFCLHRRIGHGIALLLTLVLLANPIVRLWTTYVYSDIPFCFFMMLFFYLNSIPKARDFLPLLAVFLVSLRTAGLPLLGAYAVQLLFQKDARRGLILAAAAVPYFAGQAIAFGQIPGLPDFALVIGNRGAYEPFSWIERVMHNFRSLFVSLLPSVFFYGSYGLLQASILKTLISAVIALGFVFCLVVMAGRSVLINLFLLGYFILMLAMRPEDLVHRMLLPLLPLVILGAGRMAAWGNSLYMPNLKYAVLALAIASAGDGLLSMDKYREEFNPRDYSDVYQVGEPALTEQ
ncbi:MAG: hypothetical protein M3Y08_00085 [Fibrobacterota bacterium]|nr:hypothetical protein [Fibrobacterota bacterium]